MREMKGGAVDFRMFEVHFGKMNDELKKKEVRNSYTLLGTLCYYPEDGDFYFCVYDSAILIQYPQPQPQPQQPERINPYPSIFNAICKLCGIEPTSSEGKKLLETFKNPENKEESPFHYFNSVVFGGARCCKGLKYADGKILKADDMDEDDEWESTEGVQTIRACFVLKNQGVSLMGRKPLGAELSFITYTRIERGDITQKYKNVSICTIPKMPDKLPEDDVIELPSETRNGERLGLVLVDLKKQDKSLNSRSGRLQFADYSLPVKAAMNARKMYINYAGMNDIGIYVVCYDTPYVTQMSELSKDMANTLVGTLCYYPWNHEFYFCAYKGFKSSQKTDIVHKIICNLCGISEDSEEGQALKTKLSASNPDDMKNEAIEYCIRLKSRMFEEGGGGKFELIFFQSQESSIHNIDSTPRDIHLDKYIFKLLDIASPAASPAASPTASPTASVYLDNYTSNVDDIEKLELAEDKKYEVSIKNGHTVINYAVGHWGPTRYYRSIGRELSY